MTYVNPNIKQQFHKLRLLEWPSATATIVKNFAVLRVFLVAQ
jgi:hypothetical protein